MVQFPVAPAHDEADCCTASSGHRIVHGHEKVLRLAPGYWAHGNLPRGESQEIDRADLLSAAK